LGHLLPNTHFRWDPEVFQTRNGHYPDLLNGKLSQRISR
jgi:hypothetical protein